MALERCPQRPAVMPGIVTLACAALWLLSSSLCASAQDRETDRERGSVMVGAFITNQSTDARVDSSERTGSEIDLEGDLGLQTSISVARFGGYYWFTQRQRIDVSYFELSRDSSRQLSKTIDFGDQTFAIDTVVSANSSYTIEKVDYTWAPLSREHGYLGIIAGLYVLHTSLSLSESTLGKFETHSLTAPLPVIGLRGEYAVGKHFTLRGAVEYFGLTDSQSGGKVSGRLTDSYFGADYGFGKRIAVGLAYNAVSLRVDATSSRLAGRIDWSYDGYMLYFKADFGRMKR
jgi:hypothetical protein